jgi:hypothetical protein
MLRSPKSLNPRTVFKKSRLTELWRRRKISNFQYIMELNKMAGRTFNDIMQYPVFPWILADYTSDSLNLNDSRVYRDLTKPIGALNPNRLAQLLEVTTTPVYQLDNKVNGFLLISSSNASPRLLFFLR